MPVKTRKDTEWCFSIGKEWRRYRNSTTDAVIAPTEQLDKSQLNYWLSRFILEVNKKGDTGSEFPSNTLYVTKHEKTGLMCT